MSEINEEPELGGDEKPTRKPWKWQNGRFEKKKTEFKGEIPELDGKVFFAPYEGKWVKQNH